MALVDTCMDLTRDANFRLAQGGLQALSATAVVTGEHFKIHLNGLVLCESLDLGKSSYLKTTHEPFFRGGILKSNDTCRGCRQT
ncbi:hypothetical protein PR202_gb02589 [Eleusine coracana subsp. coracana]|uniref:Uncharacterized protein n=1 Tax=Eleusine coracana subsp. coracana TaxID=191504 RepID=A0AAV5E0H1_ELECO|nr:hypothetical protein PR202_gb02589 [Eleusine coracana subsp. coracana]